MTYDSKIDVVILAGAPAGEELNPSDPNISRAMVDLGGKSMLQWVVNALRGSKSVGRIAAVGHVEAEGLDMIVEPGPDMVTNIKLGKDALKTQSHVLIVSSDIPLLTPESVDDFVERAAPLGADFALPVITRERCEERYPGIARTYLTTADGVFTAGNIMIVSHDFIENNWDCVTGAYAARKQVFKLARMLGMGVLVRVLLSRRFPSLLTVSILEQAISRMLGAKVLAVMCSYPEIGEDIDKPSDLEAVRKLLA
ncbi:MAG: NTP transferase domain-containing protein [Armatimonadetes bacterium]|nr:NTP transferase domain-containing protein [Armatimonadota bacterium]